MTDDVPEPDCLHGAPHPRETGEVYGHGAAEQRVLEAFASGRMHHAWLLTGPRGIGKATLAWRIARFLLAQPLMAEEGGLFGTPAPPNTLDIAPDHPVARRLAALSEPRFHLLRRPYDAKTKKLKQEITIDAARALKSFFGLSAADGGRRVVLVDAADELNPNAANAILKLLEEPPANATLLLVAHQPARLLPTIRSRCRTLPLLPLRAEDLARALAQAGAAAVEGPTAPGLSVLAEGSVGAAWTLIEEEGLAFYAALVQLLSRAPEIDRPAALALAQTPADRFESRLALIEVLLSRLARAGVLGPPQSEAVPGEAALLARLAPDARAARRWAALQEAQSARARHGAAVNLDPSALLLDTLLSIDAAAKAPSHAT
ncbi:MAG: DNA polymerase III subunit delta' [Pseudomonadota bacterium]